MTSEQTDAARLAVALAERGDFGGAATKTRALPVRHPVTALVDLEIRFQRGEPVAAAARQLVAANPGYGSAWGVLALAARSEGDVKGALVAARTAAGLQPDAGWARVADEVEAKIVGALIAEGQGLLAAHDAQGALARAREASQTAPENLAARCLSARALLELGDARGAAELVPALPDSGEGLELKGRVAEAIGQWDLALEFFGRLPSDYPHRRELVAAACREWRLADAPPYLRQALSDTQLRRRGLAAIIAWEVPALAAKANGAVPVFEDVVQLPEGRDVVTVARAGVMPGDPIARRFGPGREVSPRELAAVLERLAKVLGRPAPEWCGADGRDCRPLPEVVGGKSAAELVVQVAGVGGEPCLQR
ncbi:MAG TPA: hypothetical protein VMT19_02175 [Thermoanaerobaculaceae bacterium]|nr:hypothetical protein [Thermoanaerobaculaceae bacterium]